MEDTCGSEQGDYDEEVPQNEGFGIEENSRVNSNKNENVKIKRVAEGLMDISLITANANQLRFVLIYDNSPTLLFFLSLLLIVSSLILQVCVGLAIILKRTNLSKYKLKRTHQYHVAGIYLIIFINVLIVAITSCNVSKVKKDNTTETN